MIKSLLVFLITFALIYLGIAFILQDFNPSEWTQFLRGFFVFFGLFSSSCSAFVYNGIPKRK